mmetsp:Transcript_3655/g.5225  ORF Transcript_3655/g.5225 Transcript_3655/m.5225 type:complete len:191 (-) Transcript_3655:191-763(-)|eukprot:CAMPEP_0184503990 /NCGR_PEP_ID=MMETSP0113_2-20130426/52222_1 /TAXON_ID=91329 /ORGANISM="Norrisiella sphaerica, Strain BC52" /LENGTH=190 /DNA_ID=CAMNT_0026893595 /DNA_START=703 /DNA_END=1275 /DNA_ORIENTATION=-
MFFRRNKKTLKYRRELMRLSWSVVVDVQEFAKYIQESEAQSRASAFSLNGPTETSLPAEKIVKRNSFLTPKDIVVIPFHTDFENKLLNYCPDLKEKFPTNFSLVSKMLLTFVSAICEEKDVIDLAKSFAKSHRKYSLTEEHFQGFSSALCDSVKARLGIFATIELVNIWRETAKDVADMMQKELKKANKR